MVCERTLLWWVNDKYIYVMHGDSLGKDCDVAT